MGGTFESYIFWDTNNSNSENKPKYLTITFATLTTKNSGDKMKTGQKFSENHHGNLAIAYAA